MPDYVESSFDFYYEQESNRQTDRQTERQTTPLPRPT